ncbi:MAG: FAD:protein FMN transferase [Acidimicrobiales bacterium]
MGAERRFRVMGSEAHVIVVGGPSGLIDDAEAATRRLEGLWSRFLSTSEVSQLTRLAGEFVRVSAETITLVTRSLDAWRMSGGAFDPTVLGSMIRAGYDRSFEQFIDAPRVGRSLLGPGVEDIEIRASDVRLPPGSGFDPGGIGKGLAADIVGVQLMDSGADGACVNLGGDVRVLGSAPGGGAWTVAVEHPWSPSPIALLGLADGALATSTTLRRRWEIGGTVHHHLIDPQTGLPSDSDLTLVSTVAADAATAEVFAKTVLLVGSEHAFDILGGTGVEAVATDHEGRVQATPGFSAFLGGACLAGRIPAPF